MAKYRSQLPQIIDRLFLTDGGLETTLVFHEGLDLPCFASFPLLADEDGRAKLSKYYEEYLRIARDSGLGFILDTPTWRANPDWGRELGYDAAALADVNRRSVAYISTLRGGWERPGQVILLNGVIGPRGDGYKAGRMTAEEAEDYHALQINVFADTKADMVSAITMNTSEEAIGIARAAKKSGMPCVISFTVETDGRLATGISLREAIEETDAATDESPIYYMINCAHPSHFEDALTGGEQWAKRIGGLRANASAKSHAELDEATELDLGDPVDLAQRYRSLRSTYLSMRVIGGCCGTDHRHIQAICDACLPRAAAE
ncbi:MAG TPA: homocysteine S-methyltransferase family protein [Pseudorhizobium sp.]|nr:homocysteine S-methyltransferase family protein [Pseudorhizobium sp.]